MRVLIVFLLLMLPACSTCRTYYDDVTNQCALPFPEQSPKPPYPSEWVEDAP
jgi:hypothetical protein